VVDLGFKKFSPELVEEQNREKKSKRRSPTSFFASKLNLFSSDTLNLTHFLFIYLLSSQPCWYAQGKKRIIH